MLHAWTGGDEGALDRLLPIVYDDLHRLAEQYMARERPDHTLRPTALVNEAFLRLLDAPHPSWQDKAHFFAVCTRIMRRILVDWARARHTQKRGGSPARLHLQEALTSGAGSGSDLVALDDALTALAAIDPRKSQVVELRFFGGLSAKESAEVLKVSEETVLRDWKLAKSWLRRELKKERTSGQ